MVVMECPALGCVRAGGAVAANFDSRVVGMKAFRGFPALQALAQDEICELIDLSAAAADCEGGQSRPVIVRPVAGNKGIQALQPVRQTLLTQLFEGPVNLQRGLYAFGPESVENVIGAERAGRFCEPLKDELLISRQFRKIGHFGLRSGLSAIRVCG